MLVSGEFKRSGNRTETAVPRTHSHVGLWPVVPVAGPAMRRGSRVLRTAGIRPIIDMPGSGYMR